MTAETLTESPPAPRIERTRILLLRIAALMLFALGLLYWTRLVGVRDGNLWRFDLMPLYWRAAAPLLAVLCPVAGIGLWMGASWGTVLWIAVALVEGLMLFGFPATFGGNPTIFLLNAGGLAIVGGLRAYAGFRRRRRDKV